MFLGVDGGGSKTAFALIDGAGNVLARHEEGGSYHVEMGIDGVAAVLARGCAAVFAAAGIGAGDVAWAFFGLPAYGEDRAADPALDALPYGVLGHRRYLCGNDMVCSWAGSLACADGISVIAGTGSMAYGELAGKCARAGGWGELFSDEGSAYWIARAGLALFSRMSDGRTPRGPLYELMRRTLGLHDDLDLCGLVYGEMKGERSRVAALAPMITEAAALGDTHAAAILTAAGVELADMVDAVRSGLGAAPDSALAVSYTGGLFGKHGPLRTAFADALTARAHPYRLAPPRLAPVLGAALYAARTAGTPLDAAALERLTAAMTEGGD
ncbi:N-acetylglucosamine kinase-like BadF-type ATPase [Pseudoduganella flava]|uniref:N-acetylglucosamine kinase n=1 Tax=Pseudoduganella flava TaxID=871742 RepID=A0A562PK75_9BURK|nr:BadF/BadG/BcrA/BcrD ATPase family protein [Pseudoduganella flava]QGZ42325.1 N-acetylglucosamine kinase [Pseudoduganella flava]TWI44875.1 N-acetylglucosamine kinase-like BadF-type ATPase [Pseudoduganella flava]